MSSSAAGDAGAPVVEVEGLERSFGPVQALRGVGFSVPAGQVVGFLGPNGAGKTTAMRILTGVLAPDAGSARVCGHDVEREPLDVKRRTGYLPENNPLQPELRVADFLAFAARVRGLRGAARRQALERAVAATGLEPVCRRPIGECSKGFRQRVGLAQALLADPPLLILDEPTSGLDPLQAAEIRDLIRGLGKTRTVILTTHVLPEVEALAERVILLHRGRKVADGLLSDLARGDGGFSVRVVCRCSAETLAELLRSAGARRVEERPRPFGDPACAAADAVLDGGPQSAGRVAEEAARRGVPLIELAHQRATLQSLFQRLAGEEEPAP